MVKCPRCNAEIKELFAYSEVVNHFELDKYGETFAYGNDHIEGYTSFECPECHEELFEGIEAEGKAIKFLKGENKNGKQNGK